MKLRLERVATREPQLPGDECDRETQRWVADDGSGQVYLVYGESVVMCHERWWHRFWRCHWLIDYGEAGSRELDVQQEEGRSRWLWTAKLRAARVIQRES